MPSQEAFSFASSPLSVLDGAFTRRRKSRFTFKQLSHLAASSTTCPLRVIALIDLDAFYAQCETIRLGLPEDQPLAVQVSQEPFRLDVILSWNIEADVSVFVITAMGWSHRDQLPIPRTRRHTFHGHEGGQEIVPKPHVPARCYLARG